MSKCDRHRRKVHEALAAAAISAVASVASAGGIYQGPPRQGYPLVQSGPISQGFGVPWSAAAPAPWANNGVQVHTGIDLPASRGTPVYSVSNGVVYREGKLGGNYGQYLVINGPRGANGYLHVVPTVPLGAAVTSGQMIGRVYDNHLHFNSCPQPGACQYGAYPNPAYPNAPTSTMPTHYAPPWPYGR